MSVIWRVVALSSLILCGAAQAETILKCIDAAGNVTFTQTRCPVGLKLESSSEVENVPPGGGNEVVKLAEPAKPTPQPAEPAAPPVAAPADNAPQASSVGERPGPPEFVPSQSYDYQQNGYSGYPFPWPPYASGWNQRPPHGNGPRPTPQPPRPPLPGQGQGPGQNHPPAPRSSNSPTPGRPANGVPALDLRPGS